MNLGMPQGSAGGVLGLKAISVVKQNERFKIIRVEEEKSSSNADVDVQFNRYDQVWVKLPIELAFELEKSFSSTLQQRNAMLCLRMALQKFRDAEKVLLLMQQLPPNDDDNDSYCQLVREDADPSKEYRIVQKLPSLSLSPLVIN